MLVQIFAKAPIAGQVKTRLARTIGDEKAAKFAQYLLHVLLNRYCEKFFVELWVQGDKNHTAFDIAQQLNTPIFSQAQGDLGEKMLHAMKQGLLHHDKVVIVGSDCLGVDNALLKEVEAALDVYQAVFSPAEDGGFVLFAANKSFLNQGFSFGAINWGSETVWLQAQQVLQENKMTFSAVTGSWDVDSIEDLQKHRQDLPTSLRQFLEENSILLE